MKLHKRLFINGEEVTPASHRINTMLSNGGKAMFEFAKEETPQRLDTVLFMTGYNDKIEPWFNGYIEKVLPAVNGYHKVLVKEQAGILSHRWPISIEHPTMRDVLMALGDKTGIDFELPENAAEYTDTPIPNFVSQGSGYQCLKALARAFNVPDLVWFQHPGTDTIWIGAFEHSRFAGKNVDIPPELTELQRGDSITFAPFPMLRPGAIINGQRIKSLMLDGDLMTASWQARADEIPARQREMLDLFPELAAMHHLPRFGRVERVRDNSQAGDTADPFRPRYAIDVQLLDENMQPDAVPVYQSVPLPVHMSGHESGLMSYPLEGTLVEIAFAYGRNDRPIIRGIYGREYALPEIAPGEQLQQQRQEVSSRIDAAGNTTEQTDQRQQKKAYHQHDEADHYTALFGDKAEQVNGHSTENVLAQKIIEALGGVSITAGDDITLGSLGNHHTATAGEMVETIGKLRRSVAAQYQWYQAPLTWIGTNDVNIVRLLDYLMICVQRLATHCAVHKHSSPETGAPTSAPLNAGDFSSRSNDAKELHETLDPITK